MQFFPAALQDLADHFARLPGIGGKTAQRLAFHVLELRCTNAFTADMIGKPEVLEIVARKAAVQLGHPVKVITVDMSAKPDGNKRLDNLLQFGRQHSDIITMNE